MTFDDIDRLEERDPTQPEGTDMSDDSKPVVIEEPRRHCPHCGAATFRLLTCSLCGERLDRPPEPPLIEVTDTPQVPALAADPEAADLLPEEPAPVCRACDGRGWFFPGGRSEVCPDCCGTGKPEAPHTEAIPERSAATVADPGEAVTEVSRSDGAAFRAAAEAECVRLDAEWAAAQRSCHDLAEALHQAKLRRGLAEGRLRALRAFLADEPLAPF